MIGEVLQVLERLQVEENTLILFTSDNGGRLTDFYGKDWGHKANGDLRGQKADIFDGGHREPLVAMWPDRIKPRSTCDELVCLMDLMATCAAIVGEELPAGTAEDSRNILPALQGETLSEPVRESVVHHSYDGMFSLRRGDWKLIKGAGSGGFSEPVRYDPGPDGFRGQLYNIAHDRRETLNLWGANPEVVRELERELERIRKGDQQKSHSGVTA
jgi:arylsulfatase A-like enzyme